MELHGPRACPAMASRPATGPSTAISSAASSTSPRPAAGAAVAGCWCDGQPLANGIRGITITLGPFDPSCACVCSLWETALPVEAKPLFRPDALRPHLKAFQLPRRWSLSAIWLSRRMFSSGKADPSKTFPQRACSAGCWTMPVQPMIPTATPSPARSTSRWTASLPMPSWVTLQAKQFHRGVGRQGAARSAQPTLRDTSSAQALNQGYRYAIEGPLG